MTANVHQDPSSGAVGALLNRLQGVRQSGHGRWMAKCPAHEDGRASLSIRETDGGKVLVNCFGGCGAGDVIAAAGLTFSDLFPPRDAFQHDERHAPIRPNFDSLAALHALAYELLTVAMIADGGNTSGTICEDDRDRLAVASDRIHRALAAVGERRA